MNKWSDIQLNDTNNNELNIESQVSGCASHVSNDNTNNNLNSSFDQIYKTSNEFQNNSSLNQITNEKISDNKKNSLERLQSKDSILSSSSNSPNYTIIENPFDFESKGINGFKDRRVSSLLDELLNDIYYNLRLKRNRNPSVSSDTSNYSTPEFQKKSVFRDVYLKGKGM